MTDEGIEQPTAPDGVAQVHAHAPTSDARRARRGYSAPARRRFAPRDPAAEQRTTSPTSSPSTSAADRPARPSRPQVFPTAPTRSALWPATLSWEPRSGPGQGAPPTNPGPYGWAPAAAAPHPGSALGGPPGHIAPLSAPPRWSRWRRASASAMWPGRAIRLRTRPSPASPSSGCSGSSGVRARRALALRGFGLVRRFGLIRAVRLLGPVRARPARVMSPLSQEGGPRPWWTSIRRSGTSKKRQPERASCSTLFRRDTDQQPCHRRGDHHQCHRHRQRQDLLRQRRGLQPDEGHCCPSTAQRFGAANGNHRRLLPGVGGRRRRRHRKRRWDRRDAERGRWHGDGTEPVDHRQ